MEILLILIELTAFAVGFWAAEKADIFFGGIESVKEKGIRKEKRISCETENGIEEEKREAGGRGDGV